ncbi:hypothetical protein [Methylobacter sp. sgz302048]|uniref:hypothetical protein n=1 Tax=Methylobacter sp. sgz302048 TaxID=3455945 RepID=UPI003FA05523
MIKNDPNIETLELAAHALKPLLNELVLVGGCAVGLLITDQARPPVRHTVDVDLLAEVTPLSNYYKLCDKLRDLGFKEQRDIICRWIKGELVIDVMSTDEKVLGFTNIWYKLAAEIPLTSKLPSGIEIQHISAPLLIATKIESFYGRGKGDYLHHDIEDIVNLVDGRPEVIDELRESPQDLREFVEQEIDDLLADIRFIDSIPMHLNPSQAEQSRVPILIRRLRQIAGL